MAIRPIIEAEDVWKFVKDWNFTQDKTKLLKGDTRRYFEENNLRPYYDEVREDSLEETIKVQKEMRSAIRKEYGDLN